LILLSLPSLFPSLSLSFFASICPSLPPLFLKKGRERKEEETEKGKGRERKRETEGKGEKKRVSLCSCHPKHSHF
jgi:hypothetical protein